MGGLGKVVEDGIKLAAARAASLGLAGKYQDDGSADGRRVQKGVGGGGHRG